MKNLLKRIKQLIEENCVVKLHQFEFRSQVDRITNLIEKALEVKRICSANV